MKKKQQKRNQERVMIEFFAERASALFPIVKEIDVFNQTHHHIMATDRRMNEYGHSYIRCLLTPETEGFLHFLQEKYTNGREQP